MTVTAGSLATKPLGALGGFVLGRPRRSLRLRPRTQFLVTISTVVLALFFAFFAALALTRFRFRSRRTLVVLLLVAQMIPAEAMIVSMPPPVASTAVSRRLST